MHIVTVEQSQNDILSSTHMKDSLEQFTADHHFEIRERIQTELICQFYGLKNKDEVTNEQAYAWIRQNASDFDAAFKKVVEAHPSFWDDAEKDFATGVLLVEKFFEADKKHLAHEL